MDCVVAPERVSKRAPEALPEKLISSESTEDLQGLFSTVVVVEEQQLINDQITLSPILVDLERRWWWSSTCTRRWIENKQLPFLCLKWGRKGGRYYGEMGSAGKEVAVKGGQQTI